MFRREGFNLAQIRLYCPDLQHCRHCGTTKGVRVGVPMRLLFVFSVVAAAAAAAADSKHWPPIGSVPEREFLCKLTV